jgi:hypothetical protein
MTGLFRPSRAQDNGSESLFPGVPLRSTPGYHQVAPFGGYNGLRAET